MKKSELQKLLKPLIKECIKEVIFDDGVLSGLIKEVASGLGSQQTIVEAKAQPFSRQKVELQHEAKVAMEKKRRKLEESMGTGFKGILENTEPLSSGGHVSSEGSSNGPLSDYAPADPGVDITGIMNLGGGHNWKKMI